MSCERKPSEALCSEAVFIEGQGGFDRAAQQQDSGREAQVGWAEREAGRVVQEAEDHTRVLDVKSGSAQVQNDREPLGELLMRPNAE